jgi:hypothetical protein
MVNEEERMKEKEKGNGGLLGQRSTTIHMNE